MKIVCDACSAKYSIADDKVKGKVFKIRCKKCSNIIVVRGTGGAGTGDEPAPAQFDQKDTRVYDYGYDEAGGPAPGGGDEAVWHLVIDQEQVGPLTVAEVGEKFAAGQIDAESYVWREGFADWQPLSSVDAFAGVVGGGGAAAPSGGGGARSSGADAVASMFGAAAPEEGGTVRSDPGDLFGARGGDAGAGDDTGDLFGARASAPAAAAATMADGAAGKAAAKAADGKLRGERNENSVLFSLGNLAALASDSPRASAPSSSSSSGGGGGASASSSSSSSGGAAQHGGGEGSGLIDIRSMAGAYLGPQGAAKKPASSVGSIDDLPVFSAASFHEPAVILPTSGPRQNNKTMMIMIAAVGALALIAVILVLVVVLGNKSSSPPAVATNNGTGTGSASNKGTTPGTGTSSASGTTPGTGTSSASGTTPGTGSASASGTTPGTGTSSASGATPTGTDGGSDTGSKTGGDTGSKTGGDTGSKTGGDTSSSSKDHHHHDKAGDKTGGDKTGGDKTGGDKTGGDKTGGDAGGNCPDEVGCLLSEHPPSCCSKYSKKKGGSKPSGGDKTGGGDTSSGGGDLAESLDSDMIKSGVAGVKSRIFACGDKYPSAKGTVKVHVKVNPGGSVTDASASQTPDPGLGSCASSAMKGAHFQKTQRGGTFSYPFNF